MPFLTSFPYLFAGSRRGLWQPPMAHRTLPIPLFVLIPCLLLLLLTVPLIMLIIGLVAGSRRGLWQPPMAHMILPPKLCVTIFGLALPLNTCPLLPVLQCLFRGFRCRPHLRV
jgi:hypothetical protein